jgi:hypothetical protein
LEPVKRSRHVGLNIKQFLLVDVRLAKCGDGKVIDVKFTVFRLLCLQKPNKAVSF